MILNNLLGNAIKYRDEDKSESFIKITSKKIENQWVIEVEDYGQGIDKKQQSKIFEMFNRENEASDGSGLGLFIVAEAVEKLSGNIEVQSKVNAGTKITIQFKLANKAPKNKAMD
jgi:two-component system sensor histidine kinase/response regulator